MKKPVTLDGWLIEIADAYRDAKGATLFGPAADVKITENELFHIAPSVCIKFRGLKQNKENIQMAAEAALSSYIATQDIPDGTKRSVYMSFAFCYIASHYGLGIIQEGEASRVIEHIEKHQSQLERLASN